MFLLVNKMGEKHCDSVWVAAEEGLKTKHSITHLFWQFVCSCVNTFNENSFYFLLKNTDFGHFTSIYHCSRQLRFNVAENKGVIEKKSTLLDANFMYVLYVENHSILGMLYMTVPEHRGFTVHNYQVGHFSS